MHIPTWQTRDGEQIPVNRMEESHIRNSIAKIERSRRGWRREWLERLYLELKIRELMSRT